MWEGGKKVTKRKYVSRRVEEAICLLRNMSLFTSKLVPAVRNISRISKAYLPRSAIQRNYWRRRDGFSEISSAMQSIENYMKEFDREMNRVFGDFQRRNPLQLPQIFSPLDWGRTRDIPVISKDGDGRVYKLELEMGGMKPEDINITLKDNELSISARREEKRKDGSKFIRENAYHYTLPSEINPDTITSSFSNGILTIEAPLPALESKEIPIKIESGEKSTDKDSTSEQKK